MKQLTIKLFFVITLASVLSSCTESSIEPKSPKSPTYMDDPPKENTGNTNPPKG